MLSDQAISRDQMTQRKKEIAKEREALKLREQAWRDEVLKMEARSRRPAVLRCLHAIDATRIHQTRSWLVFLSNLGPFAPRLETAMLHAGDAGPEGARRPRKGRKRGAQAHAEGLYP
jgi:hypothetical protein